MMSNVMPAQSGTIGICKWNVWILYWTNSLFP